MGRLIKGINGPIVGKVGTVSGSSRNGKPYIKGPTKKRTTKISKSEQLNRDKFSLTQAWLQPITDMVRVGFKGFHYRPNSQGHPAAKSHLSHHALEGEAPDFRINPAKALISYGDLPSADNISVEKHAERLIRFSWDYRPDKDLNGLDQVMLLAYDIEAKRAYMSIYGQFRREKQDFLEVNYLSNTQSHKNGGTFHCYLGFVAADRSRQSNSVYLGTVTF